MNGCIVRIEHHSSPPTARRSLLITHLLIHKMDFTLSTYRTLLNTLQNQGFSFYTFSEFLSRNYEKGIVLRHDVDKLPGKSLEFARQETALGIRGTYYFRIVPESFDEKIIKETYELGHEMGYHYEDMNR